jgi:drug/metabolite transporter (DMT)-like permease
VTRCGLAAILFGLSTPAASLLAVDTNPFFLAGLLYIGAGLAVAPAVARRPPSANAWRRDRRAALGAVVAGGAIGPVLLMAGLAHASAASASVMLNLELAATVVLAATLFREHLGGRLVAAAGLVTLAGVVLAWSPGAGLSPGLLLVAAACVAWGVDNCITAKIDQLTPEQVVALKGLVAGSVNLAIGVAITRGDTGLGASEVLGALAIGAAGYGVSIVLWVKGARELGAARAQVIFATAPFLGAVAAWTLLGDAVQADEIAALAIAAIGVALSLDTAHEHHHHHDALSHEHEHTHEDDHHDHTHDRMPVGAHTHRHEHAPVVHAHPHVPDLHHRHEH